MTKTGRTRAEILDELRRLKESPPENESREAFLRFLGVPVRPEKGREEIPRAAREYFLLCKRASRIREQGSPPEGFAGISLPGGRVEGRDASPPASLCLSIAIRAGEIMEAETAVLALVEGGNGTFTYRAASGSRALSCLGLSLPVDERSVCGWVIRQGIHLVSEDLHAGMRRNPEIGAMPGARFAAAAPLLAEGRVLGAVAGFREGRPFPVEAVRTTLVSFAREAASLLSPFL